MCELTNQRRLGIQEGGTLKRRELKQSVSDRGGCFFMSIKECKIILVVIQNKKNMNLNLSINCLIYCVCECVYAGGHMCLTLRRRPLLVPRKTTVWLCTESTETELRPVYSTRGMAFRGLRRARGCCRWAAPQSSCSGCNWKKQNEREGEINAHQFSYGSTPHRLENGERTETKREALYDES